jgi:uncharacterized protein YcfJ
LRNTGSSKLVRFAKQNKKREHNMHSFSKIMTAAALAAMSGAPLATPAAAHSTTYAHHHRYHGRTVYAHKYCRYSSGTTGLVAGGVAGGLVGHSVLGHGLLGTAAGAVGGAVAGRAIDRSATAHQRCYYR